jgi:8-oxo-dGTP pyrophosphatase MutT (NUDIX family)
MSDDPTEAPLVQHHSAGGVVLRGRERETRVALMRSRYGTWVLPKGRLEAGETPEQAAVREIAEEVGLSGLALQAELGGTEHDFLLGDERPRKRVTWFLFLAPEEAEIRPDSAHGALDAGWFTRSQALRLLSHRDQRRVLRRALSCRLTCPGPPGG